MAPATSVDVRINTFGPTTTASHMAPVMRLQTARARVSLTSLPMGSIVNQRQVLDKNMVQLYQLYGVIMLFSCLLTVEQTYEYIVEVEISASNIELLEQIRQALTNMVFPVELNDMINITQIEVIFIGKNCFFFFFTFCHCDSGFQSGRSWVDLRQLEEKIELLFLFLHFILFYNHLSCRIAVVVGLFNFRWFWTHLEWQLRYVEDVIFCISSCAGPQASPWLAS